MEMANDSQNPRDKKNNFEFHLGITPCVHGEEIIFCITNNGKRIYVDNYVLTMEKNNVNELCNYLHMRYELYRNNAAFAMFMNNPFDKPAMFYYTFFE